MQGASNDMKVLRPSRWSGAIQRVVCYHDLTSKPWTVSLCVIVCPIKHDMGPEWGQNGPTFVVTCEALEWVPTLWQTCKVFRPWAIFRKITNIPSLIWLKLLNLRTAPPYVTQTFFTCGSGNETSIAAHNSMWFSAGSLVITYLHITIGII